MDFDISFTFSCCISKSRTLKMKKKKLKDVIAEYTSRSQESTAIRLDSSLVYGPLGLALES